MTPRVLQLALRGNSINIYSESKILRRKLSETCYVSVPLSVSGLHKVMVIVIHPAAIVVPVVAK